MRMVTAASVVALVLGLASAADATVYAQYTATYAGTGYRCFFGQGCTSAISGDINPTVIFTVSSDSPLIVNGSELTIYSANSVWVTNMAFGYGPGNYSASVVVDPASVGSGPLPFLDTANLIGGSYSWQQYSSMGGGASGSASILTVTTVFSETPFTAPLGTSIQAPAPVPEPSAWMMLVAGFGVAGATLRRRQFAALTAATAA